MLNELGRSVLGISVLCCASLATLSGDAHGQDLRVLGRQLRRPSRERVIRDREQTKRTTVDWRLRARRFDRRLTDRARDERREARETTRRVRTELDNRSRTQRRNLDAVVRRVEQDSRQQRTNTLNVTRNEQQAAHQRISERIRAHNRARNDERRERRRQVLDRIRGELADMRKSDRETRED